MKNESTSARASRRSAGRQSALNLVLVIFLLLAANYIGFKYYSHADLSVSQFYTLSYIPPKQKDDGHYHHIKVELDQPNLHLVYRKGYNAERLPTVDNPGMTSGSMIRRNACQWVQPSTLAESSSSRGTSVK